ncbi:MAG: hypothetical protein R3337_00245 [Gammaproteobacteria bacterium]|nr:hypothetical protein [Gammaproteobacteria bacterium]
MASDLTDEELRKVAPCQSCAEGKAIISGAVMDDDCRHCHGTGIGPSLSRSALTELIRKRELAAWRRGFTAGRVYGVATVTASEDDQIPLIQNPFAKGGE